MNVSGLNLCDFCGIKYIEPFFGVLGTSRCDKHGMGSFNDDSLKEVCTGCAEDNNQCQLCLGVVNKENLSV
jgi:hypothetical protein